MNKQINIILSEQEHRRLKMYALLQGKTIQAVVLDAINKRTQVSRVSRPAGTPSHKTVERTRSAPCSKESR